MDSMKLPIRSLCSDGLVNLPADIGELEVTGIECRAEAVRSGNLFVVIEEYLRYNEWLDGRASIAEAISRGALAILSDFSEDTPGDAGVPVLHHPTPRAWLGHAAASWYGFKENPMPLIGVTGTNGKTTTSLLIHHILHYNALSAGCIGTLGLFHDGWKIQEGTYTTGLALDTCRQLQLLRARGAAMAALEVSSHGLSLDRMAGLPLKVAVVTNVTRDHIDFHGSEQAYLTAKLAILDLLPADGIAVLNADDQHFAKFAAKATKRLSYAITTDADLIARNIRALPTGTTFSLFYQGSTYPVETRLIGRFQIYNVLAALAAALAVGLAPEKAVAAVKTFAPVPGRMESYALPNGAHALIDFAHNPDGLRNLLENCQPLQTARLLLVFGCGGDRDRGKRPIMGAIGTQLADHCWLTSDNPRTEAPEQIIEDILAGVAAHNLHKVSIQADRTKAIRSAYAASTAGDLIVIAGKGHEDYMIFGHRKRSYSDKAVVLTLDFAAN